MTQPINLKPVLRIIVQERVQEKEKCRAADAGQRPEKAVLEAARLQRQDLYWKSLEAVLANQPAWAEHGRPNPQSVWDFLGATGLDIQRAQKDMNDPRIAALLQQDTMDRAALKVSKTPSFFINGKPLKEFGPNGLRAQVETAISTAYK